MAKITLHPLKADGSTDTGINLYPKTLFSQVVNDDGTSVLATAGNGYYLTYQNNASKWVPIPSLDGKANLAGGNSFTGDQTFVGSVFTVNGNLGSVNFNALKVDASGNVTLNNGATDSNPNGSSFFGSVYWSVAEGDGCKITTDSAHTAAIYASHAEGYATSVLRSYSHAEGRETEASGLASHAEGYKSSASGDYSFAAGTHTNAKADNQFVVGKWNKDNSNALFIVGNGTYSAQSGASRNNAFEVLSDGTIRVNGSELSTGGTQLYSHTLTITYSGTGFLAIVLYTSRNAAISGVTDLFNEIQQGISAVGIGIGTNSPIIESHLIGNTSIITRYADSSGSIATATITGVTKDVITQL